MGRDAMFRVVLGIKFEDVKQELQEIYSKFENVDEDEHHLSSFLSENQMFYSFCDGYDGDGLVGISTFYMDWEHGFVELNHIETLLTDESYDTLMKAIDDLVLIDDNDEKEIDLTEFKKTLKEMMDCAKVYSYCDYW